MPVPVKGGRQRRNGRFVAEMNVVPYIDVMLVLLVIFMVTAPMMTQGFRVDLPDVVSEPVAVEDAQKALHVYVFGDGTYGLNYGEHRLKNISRDDLVAQIGVHLAEKPEASVLIEGDAAASYSQVAQVMGALQRVGIRRLALVTEMPDSL
jgi:biopolymer transport protein TolR